MEFVEPSLRFGRSFLEATKEFPTRPIPGAYSFRDSVPLEEYIERLRKDAAGIELADGHVPATTLWLVENEEYIGHVNIRHRLTPSLERLGGHIGYAVRPSKQGRGYGVQILAMALNEARNLGIQKVLITCDQDNLRSRKVIERNGGILQDAIEVEGRPVPTLRFWIENTGEVQQRRK